MHYLYGLKDDEPARLVATFSSEQQLLSYVRWATLADHGKQRGKFEQGSVLARYGGWKSATELLTDEDADSVPHNPTPSML